MDTRLRAWARTGEYIEEPESQPAPGARRRGRFPAGGPMAGVMVAALIPAGIVVGALLAAACVVRLLMLPFYPGADPRGDRGE